MRLELCFLMIWFCNHYSVKRVKDSLNITEDEIRTFIPVLLLSGYYKVPYRDFYLSDAPDTYNETVSCEMSRNRFREKLSNLHLAENTHRLHKMVL